MAAKKNIKATAIHTFKWNGINRKGNKVSGELQGESAAEIKAELRKQGVNVTKAQKKSKPLFSFGDKITPMDIAVISRQIATMFSAGVPLVQSLQLIAKSNEKAPLRELMGSIANEVASGTPLSQTLRGHPKGGRGLEPKMIKNDMKIIIFPYKKFHSFSLWFSVPSKRVFSEAFALYSAL